MLSRVLVEQLLEVFARQAARSALGIGVPAAEPAAAPAPEPTIATLLYGYGGCGGSGGKTLALSSSSSPRAVSRRLVS